MRCRGWGGGRGGSGGWGGGRGGGRPLRGVSGRWRGRAVGGRGCCGRERVRAPSARFALRVGDAVGKGLDCVFALPGFASSVHKGLAYGPTRVGQIRLICRSISASTEFKSRARGFDALPKPLRFSDTPDASLHYQHDPWSVQQRSCECHMPL